MSWFLICRSNFKETDVQHRRSDLQKGFSSQIAEVIQHFTLHMSHSVRHLKLRIVEVIKALH